MAPAAVVACIQIICALGKRNAMYALSASASRPEPTPYGTAKNSSSQYDGVNEKPSNATTVHATPTSTLRPEPQRRSQGSPASAAHMAPAAITTGIPMTAASEACSPDPIAGHEAPSGASGNPMAAKPTYTNATNAIGMPSPPHSDVVGSDYMLHIFAYTVHTRSS